MRILITTLVLLGAQSVAAARLRVAATVPDLAAIAHNTG